MKPWTPVRATEGSSTLAAAVAALISDPEPLPLPGRRCEHLEAQQLLRALGVELRGGPLGIDAEPAPARFDSRPMLALVATDRHPLRAVVVQRDTSDGLLWVAHDPARDEAVAVTVAWLGSLRPALEDRVTLDKSAGCPVPGCSTSAWYGY